MALTAALAYPKAPEIFPLDGGVLAELYTLTGDGSDVDVTITSSALRRILGAIVSGDASHDITSSTTNQVTLTFTTAPANAATHSVLLVGKA